MSRGAHYNIPDKLLTSYVFLFHPTHHAYTSTHLPISLLSLGTLDQYEVVRSAQRSRVGWTSARNNERTNERPNVRYLRGIPSACQLRPSSINHRAVTATVQQNTMNYKLQHVQSTSAVSDNRNWRDRQAAMSVTGYFYSTPGLTVWG